MVPLKEPQVYGKIVSLGGMTERLKVTVLKTVVPARVPWVRIPLPPLKHPPWGGARVAEWARLLSECRGLNLDRGFESRPPRQKRCSRKRASLFINLLSLNKIPFVSVLIFKHNHCSVNFFSRLFGELDSLADHNVVIPPKVIGV